MREHADGMGNTLARQTANQMTELMLANDLISMNVMLSALTRDSSIIKVDVLNVSDEVIATSSARAASPAPIIPLPFKISQIKGQYIASISLADSIAGSVVLTLDLGYLETGLVNSLVLNIAATLLLIAISSLLISTYFQTLVSFPANLLAFALIQFR